MKVSAVRLQIVCIVSVDWNDNTDLLFFLAFLPCVLDLDGQGQGAGGGGEANHEDAEEAGDDGGAPARSGVSAASEGVQSAGHEGKVYALEIMRFHPIVSQSSMFPCCRTSCSSMPVISRSIDLLVSALIG